jgi:lipooligosaccharide transport system ATP-binding protein
MEEAERLCDELLIMDAGRILDQGSPRQLIERHVEPEVIEVRSGGGEALERLAGTTGCRLERMGTCLYCYTREPAQLIAALKDAHGLTFLHRPTSLEDVFLRLTGRELRD